MAGYRDIQENAKLRSIITEFVKEQRVYSRECIYQSDRVIENAYELLADLCEVVGYFNLPEEDENEVP